MSLRTWYAKRWLKGAEQGKEGEGVKQTIVFLKAHKREASGLAAAVVAYLYATGNTEAAAWALSICTFLAGAGFIDSDRISKSRQ